VPHCEVQPYLESQRRSRARRFAANRSRRRRWSLRTAVSVLVACLSLTAGGALASSSGSSVHLSRATIKKVQRALGLAADGVYGPRTRRAVRRFQRRHGLTVDGIAGPQTLAALGIRRAGSRAVDDTTPPADAQTELAKIAQCESGGNPTAVSPDGQYRGKYQFTRATWTALGGQGDPAKAPESQQDALAAKLYAERGTSPWPNCA
jgi:peptidoglycan hydrolase-like protein with peptidoglycan-binding domain